MEVMEIKYEAENDDQYSHTSNEDYGKWSVDQVEESHIPQGRISYIPTNSAASQTNMNIIDRYRAKKTLKSESGEDFVVEYLENESEKDKATRTKQTMIKLAGLVEWNDHLWRMTHANYRDRGMKENTWRELAIECNLRGGGEEARRWFENYRNRYGKARRSNKDESDDIIKYWKFLENVKLPKTSDLSNFPPTSSYPPTTSIPKPPQTTPKPQTFTPLSISIPIPQPVSPTPVTTPDGSPPLPPQNTSTSSSRKRPAESSLEQTVASLATTLTDWADTKNNFPKTGDSLWADYVACRLKCHFLKLSKAQKRTCRKMVEKVLDDIEDSIDS